MRTAKHTVDLARPGSLKVSGIVSCGPCGGREIGDLLNGPVGKSGQDLIQVVADRDSESAATFDHGEDRSHTRSGLLAADVDPVFPIMRRYASPAISSVEVLSPGVEAAILIGVYRSRFHPAAELLSFSTELTRGPSAR
jgi:hypothetical protein